MLTRILEFVGRAFLVILLFISSNKTLTEMGYVQTYYEMEILGLVLVAWIFLPLISYIIQKYNEPEEKRSEETE